MKTNKKIMGAMVVFVMSFVAMNAACSAEEVTATSATVANIAGNAGIAYSKLDLTGKIVSADIKNSTITGKDIKRGTVSGGDIKNRTITSIDIKKGTLKGSSIADDSIDNDKLKEDAVTSDKIQDGTISNADISPTAAIDGAKISPNFGDKSIVTAGNINGGNLDLTGNMVVNGSGNNLIYGNSSFFGDATVSMGSLYLDSAHWGAISDMNDRVTLGDGVDDNIYIQSAFLSDTTGIIDIGDYNTMTDVVNLNGTTNVNGDLTGTGTITSTGLLTASNGLALTTGTLILPANSIANSALQSNVSLLDQTIESAEITDSTIVAGDIATGAVATDEILDGTIVTGDIATGGVATGNILDGTIAAIDVANDTIDGAQLADTITLDANLVMNGANVTGDGTLGEDGSRWSTIYADTLNYSSAITDDNSADTTVAFGDNSVNDAVNITANTAIADAEWSITNAGVATFVSMDSVIGSVTPAAGTFTTLIGDTLQSDSALTFLTNGESVVNTTDATFTFTRNDSGIVTITAADDNSTADLLINAGGLGGITLGDSDSSVDVVGNLAIQTGDFTVQSGDINLNGGNINDIATIGDGNDTISVNSGDWDISTTGDMTGVGNITADGTVDLDGASAVDMPAVTLGAACTVSGAIGVNPAGNAGERIMVCDGANWLAN